MAHTTASTAALDGTRSGTRGKPGSAPAMAGNMKTFSTPLVEDLLADKVKAREAKERAELEAALAAAAQPPDYHYGDGYDSALQRRQEHLLAIKQRYEDEARRAKEYQAAKREREAKAKHEQFEEIFEDVLEGMVKRQGIVADVQITLDRKERENKQFRQQLFNEWQTQVYDKIQNRIMTKVDAIQTKELKAQIRKHAQDYIDSCNTHPYNFGHDDSLRHLYNQVTYNPYAALERTVRVRTSDIHHSDPLKRTKNKARDEAETYLALTGIDISNKTHHRRSDRLPVTVWGTETIIHQPCCHNINTQTGELMNLIPSEGLDYWIESMRTHWGQDHYTFPRGAAGNAFIKAEVQTHPEAHPERRHVTDRDTKADMRAIVHHGCPAEPGVKGRDNFLNARGKAVQVPTKHAGEHAADAVVGQPTFAGRMGGSNGTFHGLAHTRRSLPQILNVDGMLANDSIGVYVDSSHLGHEKHRAAPPEARRQRKDLFETLQQKSNPYVDKRPLGDRWLEQKGIRAGDAAKPASYHKSQLNCNLCMKADEMLLEVPYGGEWPRMYHEESQGFTSRVLATQ